MIFTNKTRIIAEPGRQELYIVREFDAPRELVFRAFTEPGLIRQWLGPRDARMRIDYLQFRAGGAYRYILTDPKGNEFAFSGVIHEVTAPDRIVQTFEFEGLPERGHVSMDITEFVGLPNNCTRATIQSVFRSVADRDGKISSGMECGVVDSHQRMDELLEKQLKLNEYDRN